MGDGIVKIVYQGQGEKRFGTGVVVSETAILSARHVIDPYDATLRGELLQADLLRVESLAFFGARTVDAVWFPSAPEIDLAIIRLFQTKAIDKTYRCKVRAAPIKAVNVGDEVEVCGFSMIDGDLQRDRLRVLAVHGEAGVFICNKAVPKGYSGGPVFADDALVGLVYARNHDQGQSYFYGGQHLKDVLNTLPEGDVHWAVDDISPLRQYPLGPAVPPATVMSSLHLVIDVCVDLYTADAAAMVVARANAARVTCGPATGQKGLIRPQELPSPAINLPGFWSEAFVQAGRKSPRMLAALLESIDSEQLHQAANQQRKDALEALRGWRGVL